MTTIDIIPANTTAREIFLELFNGEMEFRVPRSRRTHTMSTRSLFGVCDIWGDDEGEAESALNTALEAVQDVLEEVSDPTELLINLRFAFLGLASDLKNVEAELKRRQLAAGLALAAEAC